MMQSVSNYIDHTNLNQTANNFDIEKLCNEAIDNNFAAVCVNPVYVPLASDMLNGQDSKVCTVVGFPMGADSTEMKFAESRYLIHQGAEELDMVLNIGALKEGETNIIEREIQQVVNAADGNCVKVIIETCLLNDKEKISACILAKENGAGFVKTSTGFSSGGANVDDIKLMRRTVGDEMGVKASGGIKTLEHVRAMVNAGAYRIGTSSGVEIAS